MWFIKSSFLHGIDVLLNSLLLFLRSLALSARSFSLACFHTPAQYLSARPDLLTAGMN